MNRFQCVRTCGSRCCSFKLEEETPLVYPWEKRFIESLAKNQSFKPFVCYIKDDELVILLYRWLISGTCPFLRGHECSIHNNKPISCRMYPLIIGLDDNTLRVSSLCPYVSLEEARLRPESYFGEEYRSALKNYILLKIIDDYMINNGWSRILNPVVKTQTTIKDIDEIIEIPEVEA